MVFDVFAKSSTDMGNVVALCTTEKFRLYVVSGLMRGQELTARRLKLAHGALEQAGSQGTSIGGVVVVVVVVVLAVAGVVGWWLLLLLVGLVGLVVVIICCGIINGCININCLAKISVRGARNGSGSY